MRGGGGAGFQGSETTQGETGDDVFTGLQRQRRGESDAPSTALWAVPLARFAGAESLYAARTREKNVATLVSRSLARADNCAVHCVMSSMAAAPLATACSTESISVEARAV